MKIEIYPEGIKSQQISSKLKAEFDEEFANIGTISVYSSKNLTLVETLVVGVIGQIVGHFIKKLIDRLLDAKKDEANKDVKVIVKMIDAGKQFELPKDQNLLMAHLEKQNNV